MVKEEHASENNFNNLNAHYRTNQKSNVFVREDILKEFEEYKNEQNLKLKNSNYAAGKIKTMSNSANEISFLHKTSTNADFKSFEGFSSSNFNSYNQAKYTNKDVLLQELLESKFYFFKVKSLQI